MVLWASGSAIVALIRVMIVEQRLAGVDNLQGKLQRESLTVGTNQKYPTYFKTVSLFRTAECLAATGSPLL